MMSKAMRCVPIYLLAVAFGCPAIADEPASKKPVPAVTPDEADADFPLQGEYAGKLGDDPDAERFGVQVIALGKGLFRAVAYPGGLPGDGWNREEPIEVEAQKDADGTVVFTSDEGTGTLKDGTLTINDFDGNFLGELKKVQRKSPTLEKEPPADAVVLFDGTSPEKFQNGRMTDDGLLMEGATSHDKFQDFTLHIEFLLSYMPEARGQGRANSGVYMQGRYEVQVLDSFGLKGQHNECGGIYEIRDPNVNMCFPPLSWQTYDIDFTAAKYDDAGNKTANARMTVRHNGVVIHRDVEVPRATRAAPVKEGPEPGPIYLQNHGNPIRFRNIWVVPKNASVGEKQKN
jgi:hypothetical protein